jgi:LacI family transcriptional regulator
MPEAEKPAIRSTLRMVAELAGVSTATVSYVMSGRTGGRTGVSPATIERVREAAAELDYHPNQAARAIRTGRTNLVLLSLTMLSDPWAQALSQAVSAAVAPVGLIALILADGDWPDALTRQPADASFIDEVSTDEHRAALGRLVRRGNRMVVFDDHLEPEGFDVIRSPATEGCRLAVRHLVASHQKIGCLATTRSVRLRTNRFQVYLDELAAAGLPVRDADVETFELDAASAYAAATRLLTKPDRPTAIYAITDFAAIGAIQAAHRLRLGVPDDVAIMGVGNTIEGERLQPSLSSVGPTDFFSRAAAIVRDKAMAETSGTGRLHEFTWSLFVRESTAGTPAPPRFPS